MNYGQHQANNLQGTYFSFIVVPGVLIINFNNQSTCLRLQAIINIDIELSEG